MIAPRAPGWRPRTAPASRHTSPAPLTPCRSDWGACFFSSCLFLFVLSPSSPPLRAYSAPSSCLAITRASHCRHERLSAPSRVIFRLLFRSGTIRVHSLHKRLIFLAGERKCVSCRRCLKGVAVRPLSYATAQSGRWSGVALGNRQNMRAAILGIPKGFNPFGRRRQILNTAFQRVNVLSTFYRSGGSPYAYC